MAIKVFIVDDHFMVIEGIRSLLHTEAGIEWCGYAINAASCLSFLKNNHPDVILMDINLPDKSGIDLCKEVKEKYPQIHILGLSTFSQQSFIEKMMANGASGYLLKNATREELLEGIEAVYSGSLFLSFDASQAMKKTEGIDAPIITRREKEVLILIADGLTNQEIAEKIFVSTTTVDSHRKNLLAKFEAKNTASLIKMAAQGGFL